MRAENYVTYESRMLEAEAMVQEEIAAFKLELNQLLTRYNFQLQVMEDSSGYQKFGLSITDQDTDMVFYDSELAGEVYA